MSLRPFLLSRPFSALASRSLSKSSLPFPTIPTCPSPTCACPATPDLDIDHKANLAGLVASYSQHLVIATGQQDWTSRIENDGEDTGWGKLVRGLKEGLRRDPFNNILVSNSSFPSSNEQTSEASDAASAYLFPSRLYIPNIPTSSTTDLSTFTRAFLQPSVLHAGHSVLPEVTRASMVRDPSLQSQFSNLEDISEEVIVLICGHGGRDLRCGAMGPLLQTVFEEVLSMKGYNVRSRSNRPDDGTEKTARVGLISHVGGHKFAGNVIIYMPLSGPEDALQPTIDPGKESLFGKGVWYGRVEPRHVEGLVEETIMKGRVIEELCRGVVGGEGELFRP